MIDSKTIHCARNCYYNEQTGLLHSIHDDQPVSSQCACALKEQVKDNYYYDNKLIFNECLYKKLTPYKMHLKHLLRACSQYVAILNEYSNFQEFKNFLKDDENINIKRYQEVLPILYYNIYNTSLIIRNANDANVFQLQDKAISEIESLKIL